MVITVPAYFDDAQREATKVAGKIAGMNVLKILSEPVAAALAFGYSNSVEEDENILVYDLGKKKLIMKMKYVGDLSYFYLSLGGGTFDVAIVSISTTGMYHVRSTNGDTRLGASKFVGALMVKGLVKSMNTKEEMRDVEDMVHLRASCEQAKKHLSTDAEAKIEICGRSITFTRGEYDELIAPYIGRSMRCVENAIKDSELSKEEINKIVLVGGGTFTPLIRSTLESFFGKAVNTSINPMEAGNFSKIYKNSYLHIISSYQYTLSFFDFSGVWRLRAGCRFGEKTRHFTSLCS